MTASVFEFGGFHLDCTRRLLFDADGKSVPLNSRAFDTLLFLIEHRGELLDKSTLLKAIWPNAVVEENNLNQSIFALRRVLGESPGEHRFIVTVPGRGYSFVAPVQQKDGRHTQTNPPRFAAPAPANESVAAAKARRYWRIASLAVPLLALAIGIVAERQRQPTTPPIVTPAASASIAVLPFVDMSDTRDQEYLSDGLAQELMNQLGQLPGLRVIGRTSSFSFKGTNEDLRSIGRKLGADHIVEGSVRKAGDRVRITAQLVNAATGTPLWSQTYDRKLGDVFAVQDEIARAVKLALSRQLLCSPAATAPVCTGSSR